MGKVVHGGALWQPGIRCVGDYDSIIAADVNDAWYPPSPRVLQAIAEWAPCANHSPDTSCRRLVGALSDKFRVDADAIRVGAGSSDLLHHIVMSSVRPGEEVLTLEPTYAEYAYAARLAGGRVRTVVLDPGTGFVADVEQIVEAIRRGPRLCVICNPNNPTGSVISRAGLLRIVDAAAPDTLVLLDEAYIDFRPEDSLFADVPDYPNLAVVRTFSKAYAMAGLRVGFAAIGKGLRRGFHEYGRPPWPVNLLGLRAAEVALEDDDFIRRRVVECNQLKDRLIRGLLAPAIQSSTNYFLIDLAGNKLGVGDLLERLRSQGVFLREFSGFSALWPDRFARITVQNGPNNERISLLLNNLFA